MNDDVDHQTLTELRRLRRSSNFAAWFAITVLVIFVAYVVVLRFRPLPTTGHSAQAQPAKAATDSWDAVRRAMDCFDYDEASAIANRIVQRYPNDYYGYAYLGNIALATGRLKDAESYYQRATDLLSIEENEKMLTAIRRRIDRESNQPTSPQ